jgi:hypothetical protein
MGEVVVSYKIYRHQISHASSQLLINYSHQTEIEAGVESISPPFCCLQFYDNVKLYIFLRSITVCNCRSLPFGALLSHKFMRQPYCHCRLWEIKKYEIFVDCNAITSTPSFVKIVVQKFKCVAHLQTGGSSHSTTSFLNIKDRI